MTRENGSLGFLTRWDTNRPIQSQKQARSLKFRIYEDANCTIRVAKTKALFYGTTRYICVAEGRNQEISSFRHIEQR